jgi:hypothetical protein
MPPPVMLSPDEVEAARARQALGAAPEDRLGRDLGSEVPSSRRW